MSKDTVSKSGVKKWLKHFQSGTIVNELRSNSKAARRFFGTLPVMRGNVLELYMICFAHQVLSLENAEVASKIELIREGRTLGLNSVNPGKGDVLQRKSDLHQTGKPCFSGAFNPWILACPSITNPENSPLKCSEEIKSWAGAFLRTLK